MPIGIPDRLCEQITMDFMMPLPLSRNLDAILMVLDKRSKFTVACPTISTVSSHMVMDLLVQKVLRKRDIFDQQARVI
jgi:hypothetical protein